MWELRNRGCPTAQAEGGDPYPCAGARTDLPTLPLSMHLTFLVTFLTI